MHRRILLLCLLKIKSDSTTDKQPTHVTFSGVAGTNLIQLGKQAANQQLYFTPSLAYAFWSGFSVTFSASYLSNTTSNGIDNFGGALGYSKSWGDHFSIDLGYAYNHYLSSLQVTSSEASATSVTASWKGKVLTPSAGVCYSFGSNHDITTMLGLGHDFSISGIFTAKDELSIPVLIQAVAGTTEFYRTYATAHPIKKKGKGSASSTHSNGHSGQGTATTATTTTTTTTDTVAPETINTSYDLTAFGLGVGVAYAIHHFTISSAISYPVYTNNPTDADISNTPNISLTASYSF